MRFSFFFLPALLFLFPLFFRTLPLYGEFLFSEDVPVKVAGEGDAYFRHSKEEDGDPDLLPGTQNRFSLFSRLDSTFLLDDYTRISFRLLAGDPLLFGSGNRSLYPYGTTPVSLSLVSLGLHWYTPFGLLQVGRLPFEFGNGVFFLSSSPPLGERWGITPLRTQEDYLRLHFRSFSDWSSLRGTLFLKVFRPQEGDPSRQMGVGYGGTVEWEGEVGKGGILFRYDRQKRGEVSLPYLYLYGEGKGGFLLVRGEGGIRYGSVGKVAIVDIGSRTLQEKKGKVLGGGGVLDLRLWKVRSGTVEFSLSGIEVGAFSGGNLKDLYSTTLYRSFPVHPEFSAGFLLLNTLWESRRKVLREEWIDSYLSLLPEEKREVLSSSYDLYTPPPFSNVLYIFPTFGLVTEGSFKFRIGVLYARSFLEVPTLQVIDRMGTETPVDDLRERGKEYGWEIPVHLSAPLWGKVFGVMEGAVAFPGKIFGNERGKRPGSVWIFQPRLTISF